MEDRAKGQAHDGEHGAHGEEIGKNQKQPRIARSTRIGRSLRAKGKSKISRGWARIGADQTSAFTTVTIDPNRFNGLYGAAQSAADEGNRKGRQVLRAAGEDLRRIAEWASGAGARQGAVGWEDRGGGRVGIVFGE